MATPEPPSPDATVRVAVLADTHLRTGLDGLPARARAEVETADVVLHAGDVVSTDLLDELPEPWHAVLGNNDKGRLDVPEQLVLDLAGTRVALVHDSGPTKGRPSRMARRFPDADVVVFGHSHAPLVERAADGPLLVNPGSPTHRRRQPVHTVARLVLGDGPVVAEIVPVGPLATARDQAG